MNAAAEKAMIAMTDLRPTPSDIRGDTLDGLSRTPKRLESKYFYDARGSQLFEEITRQPEYYLTRVELALLDAVLPDIAARVGPRAHVVEYGSGSGRKTLRLLEALEDPVAYTPIEISRSALMESTARLADALPGIEMLPVAADFTQPVPLPAASRAAARSLVFFPGSTLGNFAEADALALLSAMRVTMGAGGLALIGIDLQKDPAVLEAAYNDRAGVTAAFTLNLLERLNREIGSDFDLGAFEHRAVYSASEGRIETSLVSRIAQDVTVGGRVFSFLAGESMQVEYSHKYTDAGFAGLAARSGLHVLHAWDDSEVRFGIRLLGAAAQGVSAG